MNDEVFDLECAIRQVADEFRDAGAHGPFTSLSNEVGRGLPEPAFGQVTVLAKRTQSPCCWPAVGDLGFLCGPFWQNEANWVLSYTSLAVQAWMGRPCAAGAAEHGGPSVGRILSIAHSVVASKALSPVWVGSPRGAATGGRPHPLDASTCRHVPRPAPPPAKQGLHASRSRSALLWSG